VISDKQHDVLPAVSLQQSRCSETGDLTRTVARLKLDIDSSPKDWKITVLQAIAVWPLASEQVDGEQLDYLIGGEAFDWCLLAKRLLSECGAALKDETWWDWLSEPFLFGGFDETEFMRAVGVDKFRGHLSYFYGVTVEQALLLSVEKDIIHRRIASGRQLNDRSLGASYTKLYGNTRQQLWEVFKSEQGVRPARDGWRHKDEHTLGSEDAFIYWLFKLRMNKSDPAKIASDTRKGLAQLELMRNNDVRRKKILRSAEFASRIAYDPNSN
jgi:hypothetical protein